MGIRNISFGTNGGMESSKAWQLAKTWITDIFVFGNSIRVTIGIDNIVSDKRPEDVSPDTALWFSDFELYILFNIAWLIFSMIPAFLVSWITSVWLKLPQRPAGIKFTNNEKMNKEKLVSKLTSMGIENWEYSFNDISSGAIKIQPL